MNPDTQNPVEDSQYSASVADNSTSPDAATLSRQLAEKNDRYLRLAADFENFKRRTQRDSKQTAAAEKETFIRDLLPVIDNLERALATEHTPASNPFQQGIMIILQQLGKLLHRNGIKAIEDVGMPFDPHRHEAVCARHEPSQPDQIILEVTRRGYGCGDNIFRPAQVIVNVLNPTPGAPNAG